MDLNERIKLAVAAGWTCENLSGNLWLASDLMAVYSGIGDSEYAAWADILLDPDLWAEIEKSLEAA